MNSLFDSQFFIQNRKNLAKATKVDTLVISANAQLQASADMAFKFRQDSHFWYLTGLNIPEAVLIIDKKSGEDYLLMPKPSDYSSIFESQLSIDEAKEKSGIKNVSWFDEGWKATKELFRSHKKIGITLPHEPYIDTYSMYANPARNNLFRNMRRDFINDNYVDIRMDIARLRMIKQPQEIKAIQKAIDITLDAFETLKDKEFSHEYEIEAALSYEFRIHGASGHGYDPIVAAGKNACTLHYSHNGDTLKAGQSLLIDAGAIFEGYTADISRTFVLGEPSDRLKEVVARVQTASKRCAHALKPGLMMHDYMLACDEIVGEELMNLGLIKENTRSEIRKYYPHSTSHFLGLDAHDAGDYDMPLQVGTVLTIEPGIYIPEENIGVRIEDDYLITEDGCKNLSEKLTTNLISLKLKK